MECIRLFYFSSLNWNVYEAQSVSFVRLMGLRADFERVLIGLRSNSLHWPDSFPPHSPIAPMLSSGLYSHLSTSEL